MPYARRFYYLPQKNDAKDANILSPSEESYWILEGTSSDPSQFDDLTSCSRLKSFQDLPCEEQTNQMRYKKILGSLNKLTVRKLEKHIEEMVPSSVDSGYATLLARLVFSKALDDQMYINLYAKLCQQLASVLPSGPLETFTSVLAQLCDEGFRQIYQLTDCQICDINEDRRYIYKRRLMNMMRFVGELSCLELNPFCHAYSLDLVEKLLDKGDEIHLEAVYFLLFTFSMRSKENVWPDSVWTAVARVSRGLWSRGCSTSRMKFLYLSLVEARGGYPQDETDSSNFNSDSESDYQAADFKGF